MKLSFFLCNGSKNGTPVTRSQLLNFLSGKLLTTPKLPNIDDSYAFRLALDVKQELLGFTSLWLAYDYMEELFVPMNNRDWTLQDATATGRNLDGFRLAATGTDRSAFHVGATQRWNDKWRTWLYFSFHDFDQADVDGVRWGLGVEYQLNPHVGFGLSFMQADFDDWDDNVIRFRTRVMF